MWYITLDKIRRRIFMSDLSDGQKIGCGCLVASVLGGGLTVATALTCHSVDSSARNTAAEYVFKKCLEDGVDVRKIPEHKKAILKVFDEERNLMQVAETGKGRQMILGYTDRANMHAITQSHKALETLLASNPAQATNEAVAEEAVKDDK